MYLAEEKSTLSAVYTARSAIRHYSLIHRTSIPSPTDSEDVALVVRSIRRNLAKPVKKRKPTSKPILIKLIYNLLQGDQVKDSDFIINIDIWQVVTKTVFKFHTFARFEKILDLKKSDFDFFENGDVEIVIPKEKTISFLMLAKFIFLNQMIFIALLICLRNIL
jgi:hypothetical protein